MMHDEKKTELAKFWNFEFRKNFLSVKPIGKVKKKKSS